jgi:PAS domain S-box-containing protein
LNRYARLTLCALLILLGSGVAIGWAFGIEPLKSVLPNLSTMKFNTALLFIASGIGIAAAGSRFAVRRRLAAPAGGFLIVMTVLVLLQYATGADFKIDEAVFIDDGVLSGSGVPGRMSPLAAIAFLALGIAILLVGLGRTQRAVAAGHYVSVIAGFVAFLAAAGYTFGAQAFWGIGFYTAIAVHTAVGLMVAVAAILGSRSESGWLAGFGDAPASRAMLLKLLPLALLLPFTVGALLLLGAGLGAFDAAFGFALFVPMTAIALTVIGIVVGRGARESELALYRSTAALELSEASYRRIFEQTSDLIITADLGQVITDCNPSAAEAVGLAREEAIGRGINEFISPEDFERSTSMLRLKLDQGGTTRYDVRVRDAHGKTLFWEVNSGLTHDESGKPVGLHVVARDITERRRSEEHQQLLINELNHRVKNVLAVVQSIADQTMRAGSVDASVRYALSGRLVALAEAHDVVTREKWTSAPMREIITAALAPFCADNRCTIEGPDQALRPKTAVSLALAIHELATNASKYGALSSENGRVIVTWTATDGRLELEWREEGGPTVVAPGKLGFGSRMIERGLASELGGEVELQFLPEGVRCIVKAPLPEV